MIMNCGSRLAPSNLLVTGLRRSKSVRIMPSKADLAGSSVSDTGETSHDSTAQDQILLYDGFCRRSFSGHESSFLLHGLKQSP